jgi:DNA polymerase III epsilon subunit-like protein
MDAPIIIDLEASGFGAGSYPIEVGFVLPDGSSQCSLIQPAEGWTHWDPKAESVHGITRSMLMEYGRPVAEVANLLNRSLRGQTVYSDAWAHDYTWLSVLFEAAGLVPSFRLEHLLVLMNECSSAHWNEIRSKVERDMNMRRHRASNDARVLQTTWLRLQEAA